MRSAYLDIIKHRGVRGLYSGLSPTLIEIIPYAGLQFGSYDTFKRSMMVKAPTSRFSCSWFYIKYELCNLTITQCHFYNKIVLDILIVA
jgi:hypothetical protein